MNAISTHVLDLASGRPAVGVGVALSAVGAEGGRSEVARGATDGDGRLRLAPGEGSMLATGLYALRFDTEGYFRSLGVATFYPEVIVAFRVDDPAGRYHVPLLLGPFGYTTYRGS